MAQHTYSVHLLWQGSTGEGYRTYSRRHAAVAPPCPAIPMSADPHFRGDDDVVNPEQLLVMAASSCQLLSFLAVAAQAGIDVVEYEDDAEGVMSTGADPMWIERINLAPAVRVAPGSDHDRVVKLIHEAHEGCYIANSLRTTITITPTVVDA